jgi:predicted transcriptional regulator
MAQDKAKPTVPTSVRFEPKVKAALDKAAKADDRTASSLLQKIVSEWLREKRFLK